jgi:hypothetical protein
MKNLQAKAWTLQRPTGEIMPAFIRRTREEVFLALADFWRDGVQSATHWRRMREHGFSNVRVAVLKSQG